MSPLLIGGIEFSQNGQKDLENVNA